jgi:Skp family chaperone for outer membrane proteins
LHCPFQSVKPNQRPDGFCGFNIRRSLEDIVKKLIALAVFALLALNCGCNKDSGSSSAGKTTAGTNIGVVDPTRVFRAIGWGDELQKNIQAADNELRKQAEAHLAPARATFEQKKKDIFAEAKLTQPQIDILNTKATGRADMEKMGLSAKQIEDLIQASSAWRNELQLSNNVIQQAMSQRNAQLQAIVNETIAPVIRRVANANGRVAVFVPQQLAYFDPSVDMTDKVTDELQKNPSIKLTLPEMPRVEFPTSQPAIGAPTTAPAGPLPSSTGTTPPTTQPH